MNKELKLEKLSVRRDGKDIVRAVDLRVPSGGLVALLGPNGSGKSTLALAMMGHPQCEITGGKISLDGVQLNALPPDERSRAGLFLSMQTVPEIAGVSVVSFLRAALNAHQTKPIDAGTFLTELKKRLADLGLTADFAGRGLNENFSGGEKKRLELLQLLLLRPKYALLDEIDAGLDADAMKLLISAVEELRAAGTGILLVTHGSSLCATLRPDEVVVLQAGQVVRRGGSELAERVVRDGFGGIEKQ